MPLVPTLFALVDKQLTSCTRLRAQPLFDSPEAQKVIKTFLPGNRLVMSVRSCTQLALQAHQDRQDTTSSSRNSSNSSSSSSSSMIDRGYLGMAEALRADLQAAIHIAQHCGYCIIIEVWNVHFVCFYLQTSSCGIWQLTTAATGPAARRTSRCRVQ